jgi:hypothetical protein
VIKGNVLATKHVKLIEKAVSYVNNVTCVRFRPYRPTDTAYLEINNKGPKCSISRHGYSPEKILVNFCDSCLENRVYILQQFTYIMGFNNMQKDPNRDEWVNIHWDNIAPDSMKMFHKKKPCEVTNFRLPYDYHSVMQIYANQGVKKKGQISMSAKVIFIGQRLL